MNKQVEAENQHSSEYQYNTHHMEIKRHIPSISKTEKNLDSILANTSHHIANIGSKKNNTWIKILNKDFKEAIQQFEHIKGDAIKKQITGIYSTSETKSLKFEGFVGSINCKYLLLMDTNSQIWKYSIDKKTMEGPFNIHLKSSNTFDYDKYATIKKSTFTSSN